MQLTLLANGRLRVTDQSGSTSEIGPEHPDYQWLRAQLQQTAKPNLSRLMRVIGIAIGIGAWWYNWHDVMTHGTFSIRLTLLGPLVSR